MQAAQSSQSVSLVPSSASFPLQPDNSFCFTVLSPLWNIYSLFPFLLGDAGLSSSHSHTPVQLGGTPQSIILFLSASTALGDLVGQCSQPTSWPGLCSYTAHFEDGLPVFLPNYKQLKVSNVVFFCGPGPNTLQSCGYLLHCGELHEPGWAVLPSHSESPLGVDTNGLRWNAGDPD